MEEIDCLFLHNCCSAGYKQLLIFKKNYEDENECKLKIKTYGYLQVSDNKFNTIYNFEMETLKKHSYLIIDLGFKKEIIIISND
jgi:hypothetical protein